MGPAIVVSLEREARMTHDSDRLRDELRALLASPMSGVSEYGADSLVRRRVGRMLVDAATASHSSAVDGAEAGPLSFYRSAG